MWKWLRARMLPWQRNAILLIGIQGALGEGKQRLTNLEEHFERHSRLTNELNDQRRLHDERKAGVMAKLAVSATKAARHFYRLKREALNAGNEGQAARWDRASYFHRGKAETLKAVLEETQVRFEWEEDD